MPCSVGGMGLVLCVMPRGEVGIFTLFRGLPIGHGSIPVLLVLVVACRSGQNDTDEEQQEEREEI